MSFLLLETLLIAVFVVLDILLFYIFFESVLIPLFLIVGIWGGSSTRVRAAYLLFLYTLFGSLFMLLAFLVIYYNVGSTDFNVVSLSEINTDSQRLLWLNESYVSYNFLWPIVSPRKYIHFSPEFINNTNSISQYKDYHTSKIATENKTDLVLYGQNLSSNVGYPRFNKNVQNIITLNPYHYGVIVGILLSDGWTSKQYVTGEARITLKQSVKNSDYLFYAFFILCHYCYSYPHTATTTLKSNNIHHSIFFYTRSLNCFTNLHNDFYNSGKKGVPEDIYNILTIQGLAHWICGDGTHSRGGIILQTQSFTVCDVVRLINVLTLKFHCKCRIDYQEGKPVIFIGARSMKTLHTRLIKHIPISMYYKLQGYKNK